MYRLAPGVEWVVEASGLLLKNADGKIRCLSYPEAAIWDLISRGYGFDKVVSMVGHIAAIDTDAGKELVKDALEEWTKWGLLSR